MNGLYPDIHCHRLAVAATTIHDIARIAGVSAATVSRTLNMPNIVTSATRRKVAEAIAVCRWVPNENARRLSKRCAATDDPDILD